MDPEKILANTERLLPQPGETNGHGPKSTLDNIAVLYTEGYEAGLAKGRESGFRTGYEEGFVDGLKSTTGASATPTASQPANGAGNGANNGADNGTGNHAGPRLLGRPCVKCGAFFYSDETQCPRCNTPRVPRKDSYQS